jgi:hypothetical protein
LRVTVSELRRRRPDLDVRPFAPFGERRRGHGDEPVERLEDVDRYGRAHLRDALDLVVVSLAGEDFLTLDPRILALLLGGPDGTRRVALHAVGLPDALSDTTRDAILTHAAKARRISLLDDGSEERWKAIGARSPASIVADPALLAPRLFTPSLLEQRVAFLRAIGAWPRAERAIVVQSGNHTRSAPLSTESEAPPIVALVADPQKDEAFADAVAAMPNGQRLPGHAGVEDQVAAIAGAAGVFAESLVVREVARAFGVPAAPLHSVADSPRPIANLHSRLSSAGPVTEAERIDADFDAIAQLAPGPITNAFESSQLAAMRSALTARSRRLDAERVASADALLRARIHAESIEEQLEKLHGEYVKMRAAYDDVRNLEVVRLRVAIGHIRDRLLRRRSR